MREKIEQLRAQGVAAIAAAVDTPELEQARIAHLGRKAELPNLLRGVAGLARAGEQVDPHAAAMARR